MISVINRARVQTWYRADRTECAEYVMDVDDLVTDVNELRAAISAGMRITITEGAGSKSATSVAFLFPVITEIRDLWINTQNRITDIAILEEARNLRSLGLEVGSIEGQTDLSRLPLFEEYYGSVSRPVASVLRSPGLRFLSVYGLIPKSFLQVAGPIEVFRHEGARTQTELPSFAHPAAMRSVSRVGSVKFDVATIAKMSGLTELEVSACDDVVGLSGLSRFPDLIKLTFNGSATRERWEDLPPVLSGALMQISPLPSREFLEERREAGWILPLTSEGVPIEALSVDESGDGASWGVYMSRFEDLAEAADFLDASGPGGAEGEAFILGVVAELKGEGVLLEPEPDSESSFTAVYFPDQAQAELVFARARDALAADVGVKVNYLRSGVIG